MEEGFARACLSFVALLVCALSFFLTPTTLFHSYLFLSLLVETHIFIHPNQPEWQNV